MVVISITGGDVCSLPKETGPCRAYFPSFFYNSETKQCESFVYGGCRGNGNRFSSKSECEEKCLNQGTYGGCNLGSTPGILLTFPEGKQVIAL